MSKEEKVPAYTPQPDDLVGTRVSDPQSGWPMYHVPRHWKCCICGKEMRTEAIVPAMAYNPEEPEIAIPPAHIYFGAPLPDGWQSLICLPNWAWPLRFIQKYKQFENGELAAEEALQELERFELVSCDKFMCNFRAWFRAQDAIRRIQKRGMPKLKYICDEIMNYFIKEIEENPEL